MSDEKGAFPDVQGWALRFVAALLQRIAERAGIPVAEVSALPEAFANDLADVILGPERLPPIEEDPTAPSEAKADASLDCLCNCGKERPCDGSHSSAS